MLVRRQQISRVIFCYTQVKSKGEGSFYIAQYPVRWSAQSALHFLPSLTDLFIPTPTRLRQAAITRQD